MTSIARSNRCHIAVFGRRNAGKSSLVNALVGQAVSIVSDVAGTTTDTVWKNIELPGVGAAVIADTAGFDDAGELGLLRVDAARKVLGQADVAILLLGEYDGDAALEKQWLAQINEQHLIKCIPWCVKHRMIYSVACPNTITAMRQEHTNGNAILRIKKNAAT